MHEYEAELNSLIAAIRSRFGVDLVHNEHLTSGKRLKKYKSRVDAKGFHYACDFYSEVSDKVHDEIRSFSMRLGWLYAIYLTSNQQVIWIYFARNIPVNLANEYLATAGSSPTRVQFEPSNA